MITEFFYHWFTEYFPMIENFFLNVIYSLSDFVPYIFAALVVVLSYKYLISPVGTDRVNFKRKGKKENDD